MSFGRKSRAVRIQSDDQQDVPLGQLARIRHHEVIELSSDEDDGHGKDVQVMDPDDHDHLRKRVRPARVLISDDQDSMPIQVPVHNQPGPVDKDSDDDRPIGYNRPRKRKVSWPGTEPEQIPMQKNVSPQIMQPEMGAPAEGINSDHEFASLLADLRDAFRREGRGLSMITRHRVCDVLANPPGWSTAYQVRHRQEIRDILTNQHSLCGKAPAAMAKTTVLSDMLKLYDKYFFGGLLNVVFGNGLVIAWNVRLTSTGGRCTTSRYERMARIEVSIPVMQPIHESGGAQFRSGGLTCDSVIGAVQLTLEHELVHAIIGACCADCGSNSLCDLTPFSLKRTWTGGYKDSDGHSTWFTWIQFNLFGQTEFTHSLTRSAAQIDHSTRLSDDNKAYLKGLHRGATIRIEYRNKIEEAKLVSVNALRFRCTLVSNGSDKLVPYRFLVR
jgi:hypothetical protein